MYLCLSEPAKSTKLNKDSFLRVIPLSYWFDLIIKEKTEWDLDL